MKNTIKNTLAISLLLLSIHTLSQSTLKITAGAKFKVAGGTTATHDNLIITGGGQVLNRGNLTVKSTLSNNTGTDGLILQSDSAGYGSLLHHNTGVYATVEQHLTSEKWHLVTSPVVGETIGSYLEIYLKQWNEPTATWNYLIQPLSIPLVLTRGYSAWTSDDITGEINVFLEGELVSGDAGFSYLGYTANSPKAGWNLVGNPYPSPVEWNTDWFRYNVGGWAVVYDNGTSKGWNPWMPEGQRSYNGKTNGMIAPTQGFWIRALGNDPYMTVPQSARKHNLEPFYKEAGNSDLQYLKLTAKANGYVDETNILFMEEGTEGFDGMYDLEKHWNIDEAPGIYSEMDSGSPLAVNVLPENWISESETPFIPVGYKIAPETVSTISANGIETFESSTPVFLLDKKEGTFHDLRTGGYDFTSKPGDEPLRFVLHFAEPSAVNEQAYENISIYAHENTVIIKIPSGSAGVAEIFDMLGKKIVSFDIHGGTNQKTVNIAPGYYIVKIVANEVSLSKKLFLKP